MIQDRRKYPRNKDFVRIRVVSSLGEQNLVTTDIGPTGAFVAAATAPPDGEIVRVIARPEGMKVAPIELEAVVVRSVQAGGLQQPGFAVQWLVARSEAGGLPLYQVLKRVLRVPEVTAELFGHERDVAFPFPEVGDEFAKVLSLESGPRGPLLQSTRTEKRAGPTKAPPPVQTPLQKPPDLEPGTSVWPRAGQPNRPRTSTAAPTSTSRSTTFAARGGRGRVPDAIVDDVMMGAGALRHRESDVTQLGGRSKSLTARRDSGAEQLAADPRKRSDVTIVDDIRLAPIGAVGKSRIDKLVDRARARKEAPEQKASVGERSQIFGKSARLSSIGGRSMSTTIREGASAADAEQDSVKVDLPVTYELDNQFVPARVVQAAPLALEVVTSGTPPQLDRNVVINMPVLADGMYRTIYVMGKLLRLPEPADEGHTFVFHIERVHEGDYTGAFANFIANEQAAVGE